MNRHCLNIKGSIDFEINTTLSLSFLKNALLFAVKNLGKEDCKFFRIKENNIKIDDVQLVYDEFEV